MVRIELAADDSFAAVRSRSRFGIAIAAMIRIIATTISNSISEKPFCFPMFLFPLSKYISEIFIRQRRRVSGLDLLEGTQLEIRITSEISTTAACAPQGIQRPRSRPTAD